jgi:hypothetical protein
MNDNTNTNIIVGKTRIQDSDGYIGTIVYIGPVASAKDTQCIYAGIVWDDPTRGIHDGSVQCRITKNIVRHFDTYHPTAGSFIKLSLIDTGRSLTPNLLVNERYVTMDNTECVAPNNIFPNHTACTTSGKNNKPIEFYGEMKIRSYQQVSDLAAISIRRSRINSFDKSCDWSNLHHIQEIDLAGNLLCNWDPFFNIICYLPSLTKISFAGNRLGDIEATQLTKRNDIMSEKLLHLNINEIGLQNLDTILYLGYVLPQLEELIIDNNSKTKILFDKDNKMHEDELTTNDEEKNDNIQNNLGIDPSLWQHLATEFSTAFQNLRFLDCSNCCSSDNDTTSGVFRSVPQLITTWSLLPKLEFLNLDDNPIRYFNLEQVRCNNEQVPTSASNTFYRCVRHIQLSGTQISDWSDLDLLNQLPSLLSLRLRYCPLLQGSTISDSTRRSLIISRLPHLQVLNGSVITDMEQREAARWCIRNQNRTLQQKQESTIVDSTINSNNPVKTEIVIKHPQYDYWVSKYPELVSRGKLFSDRTDETILADTIINVTIRSMVPSSCTMEPIVRKLPRNLTIGRLKGLCSRHFGLDVDLILLQYVVRSDEGSFPIPIDQSDDTNLDYYGIPTDGAEILMHEIEK